MNNDDLVQIDNVSKAFSDHQPPALSNISATIPKGQMVGIAGPDGAGKTTLIRLMAGLLRPTTGEIFVGGFNTITQSESIHQIIGYMPQKFGLYEDLTVQQNLNLYADLQGVTGTARTEAFQRLLAFTNLGPFTNRLSGALSGGMKQKLGLACSLIRKPTLLLLDEPSVGVDPISRRELWAMVKELLDTGISVVWSTAYLNEAERCDKVLLLSEGKLLFHGTPKDLTERVKGRTFKISHISGSRRSVLTNVLIQKNVIDGVIQGSEVHFVLSDQEGSTIDSTIINDPQAIISPTSPRFEDAFIDILGGGPGGVSVLAEKTPKMPASNKIVVEAKGLTKKFGSFTAADHITFQVKQGEIFGLLGPNGAGKTTTFKMLCGLLKPTSGTAVVAGYDLLLAPSAGRARIGYMAQKFSLYGNLSVLQNLNFFSGVYNLSGHQQTNAVDQMIEIFNLKEYLDESAENLPLGYKQRLALSCAVMHRPDVLFLDEPTSGVDPITRREFWNHINGLVEKGVTVMVTTHFMDEAESCDRIALVYKGKIIILDTPDQLKEQAKSSENPSPTLEDAFIKLVEHYDAGTNGK